MLSSLNVSRLVENGFDFIVGARMNSLDDDLTTEIIAKFYKTNTDTGTNSDQRIISNTNNPNDNGSIDNPENIKTDPGQKATPNTDPQSSPGPSLLATPEPSIQLADISSSQSTNSQPSGTTDIKPNIPVRKTITDGTIKTFVYTTTVVTRQTDSNSKTTKTSQDYHYRFIVSYSAKRAKKDLHTIDKSVTKAKAIVNGQQTLKRRSTFVIIDEPSKKATSLNQAAIDRKTALAGLKGYITNLSRKTAPNYEIISQYSELWHVEKSFRISKHDLRVRPLFHYKEDSIKAHLLIVVMALAISKLIEKDSEQSIQKTVEQLSNAMSYTLKDSHTGATRIQHPQVNELNLPDCLAHILSSTNKQSDQECIDFAPVLLED